MSHLLCNFRKLNQSIQRFSSSSPRHVANGLSHDRLDRLLLLPACRCPRRICFGRFRGSDHRELLKRFCTTFWSMKQGVQDAYVQGSKLCLISSCVLGVTACFILICTCAASFLRFEVKHTVGPSATGRRKWFLLDRLISPKCLVALIGIGNERLKRILEGRWDRRRSWGLVPQNQSAKFCIFVAQASQNSKIHLKDGTPIMNDMNEYRNQIVAFQCFTSSVAVSLR